MADSAKTDKKAVKFFDGVKAEFKKISGQIRILS